METRVRKVLVFVLFPLLLLISAVCWCIGFFAQGCWVSLRSGFGLESHHGD